MSTIYNQAMDTYGAMKKTIAQVLAQKEYIQNIFNENKGKRILFTGCGTSFYQCRTAELALTLNTGLQTLSIPAGDGLLNFERYRKYLDNAMVITFSRSGKKPEANNFLKLIKEHTDAKIFAITCTAGSELKEIADYLVEIPWAFDSWHNQTRSIVNLSAAFITTVGIVASRPDIIDNLSLVAEKGDEFINKIIPICRNIATLDIKNIMIASDADSCGLAEVGALMFDEIPYLQAQYRHIMDSFHGPQGTVDKDTLVLMLLNSKDSAEQTNIVKRMLELTKKVVVFKDKEPSGIKGVMADLCFGQEVLPEVVGLPFVTLCQFTSYLIGIALCRIADFEQDDFYCRK